MSQNIPPGSSGRPPESADSDPTQPAGRDADRGETGQNPYYANQQGAPPDLDANAPQLRSSDTQRLNRKALLFLAGIVALLILAIFWTLRIASSDEEQVARPTEEAVVIPALPRTDPVQPPVDPIAVAPYDSADLPPLPDPDAASPSGFPGLDGPQSPTQPSLLQRRMMAAGNGDAPPSGQDAYAQPFLGGLPGAPGGVAAQPAVVSESAAATRAQFINNPDALLVRGTYIRCVLETRIITDIPGFTSCIVTEPVYSINGRRLLLPKGSKVLGSYDMEPTGPRVAVVWDRITTPNGFDVSMSSPGVDNLGSSGHPGDYNAHWGSRITSALLISLISDAFKYVAAEEGPPSAAFGNGIVVQSPYESTTARTMERLANDALDRSGRRPATVTINQGTVVNVYVARDVDFSGVVARL